MTSTFQQRLLVGKQPAHILLVDLSKPISSDVGDNFCDALENLFAVACNFSGPSRIPFFSLMVLKGYSELILPFSYVRNNFPRIQTAVAEIRTMVYEANQVDKHSPCFDQGLADACSQYRRQLQSTLQTGGFCDQLEIVIVTCQKARHVQKQVEVAMSSLDMEHVKRIQVLSLSSMDISPLEELSINNSQASDASAHSSNNSITATELVEVVTIEADILCLQNYFSGWLLDTGTESEHMHIILPPSQSTNDGETEAEPVIIKCDLHKRLLHPAKLPFGNQFTIDDDSSGMKLVFPSTSKAMSMTVPVYRLHVTALVPITSLCDSVVFGMPMIATPTVCWKIDWDDLEKNQQLFRSLCHSLYNKDQAAIAELQCLESVKTTSRNSNSVGLHPTGHFALLPSGNGSLLVKCLAVQELMLPYHVGNQSEDPAADSMVLISDCLDQVEVIDCYNPLDHPSNMYECLKNIGKKTIIQQQQKRSLENGNSNRTNRVVTSKTNKFTKSRMTEEGLEDDFNIADTPLSKRVLEARKAPKRALYTEANSKYLPDSLNTTDEQTYVNRKQLFRSGQTNTMRPVLSFPTSL